MTKFLFLRQDTIVKLGLSFFWNFTLDSTISMTKLLEIWEFKFQFRRQPKAKSNTLWLAAAAAVGCFQNGADFFLEAGRHVVMLLYDTFANVISAASIPCQESLASDLLYSKTCTMYWKHWSLSQIAERSRAVWTRSLLSMWKRVFRWVQNTRVLWVVEFVS